MAEYHAAQNAVKPPVERWLPFPMMPDHQLLSEPALDRQQAQHATDLSQHYRTLPVEEWRKGRAPDHHREHREKLASMRDTPLLPTICARFWHGCTATPSSWAGAMTIPWMPPTIIRTGKGFPSWSEDEIDAFDARWPFGTRERLAKELLLATARQSDVLRVGPAIGRRATNWFY
jgi:hypothetical protein